MSSLPGVRGALRVARSRLRLVVLAALAGAVAGLAWGLAFEPEYEASAGVVISDRGELVDRVGGGAVSDGDRLIELAGGGEVAALAAASLGDDVAGADLLSRTDFAAVDGGASLRVSSVASFPDFAAAAADAFAGAIVEAANAAERRRLRRAEDRLEEQIAGLDPFSERATALTERLDAVSELRGAGPPLRLGSQAELPRDPVAERSVAGSALAGAGLGGLIGILFVGVAELVRRPVRDPEALRAALGSEWALSGDSLDGAVLPLEPGLVEIDADAIGPLAALLGELGGGSPAEPPASLAVTSARAGEGTLGLAIGLAAAAASTGRGALLVETDMREPRLAGRLGLEAAGGLGEYLEGKARPREIIESVLVTSRGSSRGSIVCLGGGSPAGSPEELLAGPRFRTLVERLQRVYDLVVFATPPLLEGADAALVAAATPNTVLVARAGQSGRADLARAGERLGGAGVDAGVLLAGP